MKSTRRIGLLLALVFLLPALFFSVYELSSLDKDEKMIQEIYGKQLEAILFSVNQYADDVIGNWISRIETGFGNSFQGDSTPARLTDLLRLNPSLLGAFQVDTVDGELKPNRLLSSSIATYKPAWHRTARALRSDSLRIKRLVSYKESGFQKVERLDFFSRNAADTHCLVYITESAPGQFRVAGIYIDPELFIEDVVGPRLQVVAREQFILSVLMNQNDSVVYATQQGGIQESEAEAFSKEFWILPDYALGIRTSGNTLRELVRDRTKTNFMLLVALDVILILAVVLVFHNLKKEVDLAQNKTDFVSNVSHEIRTPLALISMFAETLELDRVSNEEKKRQYYGIISKETQRLTGIVNKILNFSQTEARKKVLHIEILDMRTELKGILATYDFHLRNKGFDYSVDSAADVRVKADREAFTESIINLLDNAMKYTEAQKRIEITTGTEGEYAFVAVKDYGVGIGRKEQQHIFDKFYRVPGGNLARSRGTGLGLSLVKQLMEDQKGKITVKSEPGNGSVFTLYFLRE